MKLTWPRTNPHNKRWFQIQVGKAETVQLADRVTGLVLHWDPRLFARGINLPPCLLAEQRRLAGIVARGGVDWGMFPKWVKREER